MVTAHGYLRATGDPLRDSLSLQHTAQTYRSVYLFTKTYRSVYHDSTLALEVLSR